MLNCNLCETPLIDLIYESGSAKSLTSLCMVYPEVTRVYFCHICGHVQSVEIGNIDSYYDKDYDILVASEEEDQIYEVVDGRKVYRTDHQVATLLNKIELPPEAKILDYGCAKSSTMQRLAAKEIGIQPFLYDVSDRYIPFWKKFLTEEKWATYSIPVAWGGKFDAVTSFFSLEHIAKPQDTLRQIIRVLKPAGIFYGIVPNVFTNTADMIVIDHVNHFTATSLCHLLSSQGFESIEIDAISHKGALIFTARKGESGLKISGLPAAQELQTTQDEVYQIAEFWNAARDQVGAFAQRILKTSKVAIYGAGFYGAFISSCLPHPELIVCLIDQNPFLQGKKINGVPVISPAALPDEIDVVMVGLNPKYARRLIDDIAEFKKRNLSYFFL